MLGKFMRGFSLRGKGESTKEEKCRENSEFQVI